MISMNYQDRIVRDPQIVGGEPVLKFSDMRRYVPGTHAGLLLVRLPSSPW
jgi:hypothetical protein